MLPILVLTTFLLAGFTRGQSAPDAGNLTGAYEGILAYTAYLTDASLNGNESDVVYPDCVAAFEGQKLCSFDQFIQNIVHANQALLINSLVWQTTNIDELAEKMIEAGAVGPWNAKALFGGLIKNSGDSASFIFQLAKYLGANVAESTGLVGYALESIQRVNFLRGFMNLQDVESLVANKYGSAGIQTIARTLYPGGPSYNFFDMAGTAHANPSFDVGSVQQAITAANAAPDASVNAVRAATSGQVMLGNCQQ